MNKCKISSHQALVFTFAFIAMVASHNDCRGDLIITYKDTFNQSGKTGYMDVYIHSTDGTDLVQFANYTFDITTPNTGAPGFLRFQSPQSKSEQDATAPDVPYFLGTDKSSGNFGAVPLEPDRKSITGFDSTKSGDDVLIGTSNSLLARFELEHEGAALSGQFTISLRKELGLSFYNSNAVPDDTAFGAASYNNFGRVTVSPTAIPEPSSLLLCPVALVFLARRSRRVALGTGRIDLNGLTNIKVGKEVGDGRRKSFEHIAAVDDFVLANNHSIRWTRVHGNTAVSTIDDPNKLRASGKVFDAFSSHLGFCVPRTQYFDHKVRHQCRASLRWKLASR